MDFDQLRKLKPGTLLRTSNPPGGAVFQSSVGIRLESGKHIWFPENSIVMFLEAIEETMDGSMPTAIVKALVGEKIAYIMSINLKKI